MEKVNELLEYLKSLGFEGKKLEADIKRAHEKSNASFRVNHRLGFGDELMLYSLRFVYDRQFMAYRLEDYNGIHRLPVSINHALINGVDTSELEHRMSQVDWEEYFESRGNDIEVEKRNGDIINDLHQLTAIKNFDGQQMKAELIFKYWPRDQWDSHARELQSLYEVERSFTNGLNGLCNAVLAFHTTSGDLDNIYESIRSSGIEEYPGIDLYSLLSVFLSKMTEGFEVELFSCQKEGVIDFCIPVNRHGNRFHAEENLVAFTPYPTITHGNYNGVNSAELENKLKQINWNRDEVYLLDEVGDVQLLPYITELEDKVTRLSEDKDGRIIADYLRLRYWSHSKMEIFVYETAHQAFDTWPKIKCDFPLDMSSRCIYNLMCGRLIHARKNPAEHSDDHTWLRINSQSRNNNGFVALEKISGISEGQLQDLLDMLPLTADNDFTIRESIMDGDMVHAELKNGSKILLSMRSDGKTIQLSTSDQRPIPFNFHFDPDWTPKESKYETKKLASSHAKTSSLVHKVSLQKGKNKRI